MASGQTYTVAATTTVSAVTIEQGGVLTAPAGYSLTMTVNGVETGQVLAATSGADTVFVPGSWRGQIVLTVTEADDVTWQQHVYPFRQAIYADSTGLVSAYSVLAAAVGGQVGNAGAYGVRIASTGQCFDGVFVNGGSYALERPVINLNGNGRCDFVGYGAALVANNAGTRVVVDGATISNQGAVRTAAICDNGATLVVKNSSLSVKNGVLPADYVPTVNLDTMWSPRPGCSASTSTATSAPPTCSATTPSPPTSTAPCSRKPGARSRPTRDPTARWSRSTAWWGRPGTTATAPT